MCHWILEVKPLDVSDVPKDESCSYYNVYRLGLALNKCLWCPLQRNTSEPEYLSRNFHSRRLLLTLLILRNLSILGCLKSMRHLLRQINRNKRLGQLHRMKLCSQRLNNLLPILMRCETPPRCTPNGMLRIKLPGPLSAISFTLTEWCSNIHVQRIKSMTTRRYSDADTVIETFFGFSLDLLPALVQFEAYLT